MVHMVITAHSHNFLFYSESSPSTVHEEAWCWPAHSMLQDLALSSLPLTVHPEFSRMRATQTFEVIWSVGSGKIPLSATATVQILITEPCEQPTQLPYPTTTYPQIFTKPPLSAPPPRFNQGLYLFTYRCASGDSVIGSVQVTKLRTVFKPMRQDSAAENG